MPAKKTSATPPGIALRKDLITEIKTIITSANEAAIRSVDVERVRMYWNVGRKIFEEEQQGKERADYGTYLIQSLSGELEPLYGTGFSVRQLERYRQFYRTFPIASALRTQFNWTHYKLLISIDNTDKRDFYMAEAEKNNWTARQLERQINSQLFERLLLSNDVQSVLAVARNEKQPADAKAIIKDPMVLEFLGLKREAAYYEHDLEGALLTHLQDFCWSWVMAFRLWRGKNAFTWMAMSFLRILYFTTACCNVLC